MSLPARYVLVDLETTGAHPLRDRITEIAILRIERGQLVQRWESLINPGVPIPPTIQGVTGIDDTMVAGAPDFAAVADTVAALLDDCVFVAHNARFDYGFLKTAYAALGREFDAPVLCTVKLSRALYPDHHRHGLDAIIERHGLACGARHRAMGDTEVLWQFARVVEQAFPAATLARAVERAMKAPARPPDLPEGAIEGLPEAPGVYLYFASPEAMPGEGRERPLYIGRAGSLRGRVMEQFAAAARGGKEADFIRRVQRVEWVETAGELGAQLLEAELLRSHRPPHNRQPERGVDAFALRHISNRKRPPILERVTVADTDPATWDALYGCFRSPREADNLLREFALLYQLCPRRLGLEHGGAGPCSAHLARRCAGVCAGRETFAAHDARLLGALGATGLKPWPWAGPAAVVEAAAHRPPAFHVFDRWCYLGSTEDESELPVLAAQPRRFDLDLQRLLARWFATPGKLEQVRPLPR
ncbi:putative DNA-directed polymerase III [Azoarcus olearius]|uniref:exonuclease domain-containing protein n=1 Tax=Azoarcus sp. (strain BH72) TaxID=418699 RepID=UPI0008061AE0|nr:exonuclease domain-containing protein [Azoarcus olearius]ANQ87107.1 putative DNA-directed polymerase III [Azoarcus olearius]